MSAKKLTQAVFEGLPSEYRWAAVDRFGVCAAFTKMPVPAENGSGWRFDDGKMKTLWCSNERRLSYFMIQRQDVPTADKPESITDVARSIEAARIEEQACMPYPDGDARYFETSDVPETKKYPHYFKDVSAVDAIDLYHVARLYDITDPALFHAFKKIACAGKRGAKDQAQDVQEAIDALQRWQELNV